MATITQPYGIVLPIAHGPQGYFNQSYNVLDQIKSNLNVLLRTKKGERRMNPEFGSELWGILFENYTDEIEDIIKDAISSDIKMWMPYINIKKIVVNVNDIEYKNKYKVGVNILFTVPSVGINRPERLEVVMNANNI